MASKPCHDLSANFFVPKLDSCEVPKLNYITLDFLTILSGHLHT